jgi:hypothetical protein
MTIYSDDQRVCNLAHTNPPSAVERFALRLHEKFGVSLTYAKTALVANSAAKEARDE